MPEIWDGRYHVPDYAAVAEGGRPVSGGTEVEDFSDYLRRVKNRTGRSYQAIGRRIGISASALHRYCSGGNPPPTFGTVEMLARECGADRHELLELRRLWTLADASRRTASVPQLPDTGQDDDATVPAASPPLEVDVMPEAPAKPASAGKSLRRWLVAAAVSVTAAVAATSLLLLHPARPAGVQGGGAWPPSPDRVIGAVGRWHLGDESRGEPARDSSGHHADANAEGGVDPVTTGNHRAVSLDHGHLSTTRAVVRTDRSFSVAAWVLLADTRHWATAVSQDGDRVSGFFLQYSQEDDRWALSIPRFDRDNSMSIRAMSTNPPKVGIWTHLVGVYDAPLKQIRLYVNGALEGTATRPGEWSANGDFQIGRAWWNRVPVDYWSGKIDEVAVFPRVLSDTEVRSLAGLGGTGPS